jgi:hypothetical protein
MYILRRVRMGNAMNTKVTARANLRWAKKLWQELPPVSRESLREISELHGFSIALGDLLYLNGAWYVTHTGAPEAGSAAGMRGN